MNHELYCPVCEYKSDAFLPHGIIPRKNAKCPNCLSLERHRLLWLFLKRKTDIFSKQVKMLHFAPEKFLRVLFNKMENIEYVTADLFKSDVDFKVDITDMKCFKDNSFDFIVCSHVMEHVKNDDKAFSEMYRILKPNGYAVILVPVKGDTTKEEPVDRPYSDEERTKYFGQSDHVRFYGLDITERIENAGLNCEVYRMSEMSASSKDPDFSISVSEGYPIFYCKKDEDISIYYSKQNTLKRIAVDQKYCCFCKKTIESFLSIGDLSKESSKQSNNLVTGIIDSLCPICGSHRGARHLHMFLEELNIYEIFKNANILYVNPEEPLLNKLRLLTDSVDTGDFYPEQHPISDENISENDQSNQIIVSDIYTVVIARLSKEDIAGYQKTIQDIHQVLKPGGLAVLHLSYSLLHNNFTKSFYAEEAIKDNMNTGTDYIAISSSDLINEMISIGFEIHLIRHHDVLSGYNPDKYGVHQKEPLLLAQKV